MITAMPLCMQAGLAGGACDRSCKDFDREGRGKSEVKPSISDALAARGKSFPARCYLRSRPRFDETIASRGGGFLHHAGVAVGYDWQIGRALLTLYAMGFYSLDALAQGRAVSWHSAARRDIQRREARSAIGSRCMQTVGRVRHWASANDGVVGGRWWCTFLR